MVGEFGFWVCITKQRIGGELKLIEGIMARLTNRIVQEETKTDRRSNRWTNLEGDFGQRIKVEIFVCLTCGSLWRISSFLY